VEIKTDRAGNPILDQFSEEGFVDFTFRIVDLKRDRKHYRFHLAASHNKKTVGLNVVLVRGIKSGFNAKMNLVKKHNYRPGVRFLRSGPESDRLIATISKLYGLRKSPKKMAEEETFTAIALHQGRLVFEREPVKLKLFGGDDEPIDPAVYYESFFNVDLANGFVFWNEKDPEYRKPLVQALSV
jgi:hypothetical protein